MASCGGGVTAPSEQADAAREDASIDADRPGDGGSDADASPGATDASETSDMGNTVDGDNPADASDASDAIDASDGSEASDAAVVTMVAVSPATTSTQPGCTAQFTARATYSDGSSVDVTSQATWSSADTTIATVDATGLASTIGGGSVEILATYAGQTGHALLVVSPSALQSIAVTPATATIDAGATLQYTAIGTYGCSGSAADAGWTADLTGSAQWQSSVPAVATCSPSGLATGLAAGTTTITATSGGLTSSGATLKVVGVTSVAVSPSAIGVDLQCPVQFHATAQYSDGSSQDVTTQATWSTAPTGVATIDQTGLAIGQGPGSTLVFASYQGVTSPAATLTEAAGTLVTLTIAPASASVAVGATQAFTATGLFSSGNTCDMTVVASWQSSATGVATITSGGHGAGVATGVAAGSTSITASVGAISASAAMLTVP